MAAETCTVRVHMNNLFGRPAGGAVSGEIHGARDVRTDRRASAVAGRRRRAIPMRGAGRRSRSIWRPALPGSRPPRLHGLRHALPGRPRPHTRLRGRVLPPWFPPIAWASCWGMSWCTKSRTCCRASAATPRQGVMKAHWDIPDFRAMEVHPLPFDELDVLLIHAGARRSTVGEPLTSANE